MAAALMFLGKERVWVHMVLKWCGYGVLVVLLALSGVTGEAWADDLPLTVEDLITDKGKFKLDLSFAYANRDHQGISTGEPVLVQTGATSFVTVPGRVGESTGNTDGYVPTIGLRYGLSAKTEVYARASMMASSERGQDVNGVRGSSTSQFSDFWTGINYQFKEDDDTPAVLGFAELALSERRREDNVRFKSAVLGVTAYKAIDPVVFSVTSSYRFGRSSLVGSEAFKPGSMLQINPSVALAVNDRVTLSTGVQWLRHSADVIEGQRQSYSRTGTDLVLGLGYGFGRGNTLHVSFRQKASGQSGAELRAGWLYTFR
ncbi:MAG: hypothetical protein Q4B17_06675 [Lautropia sp.]|nr:hypothetical protein [Lautropia sp.]